MYVKWPCSYRLYGERLGTATLCMLNGSECQRTELTVYSTQAFNNVVILFLSSRKCGTHPLPLPHSLMCALGRWILTTMAQIRAGATQKTMGRYPKARQPIRWMRLKTSPMVGMASLVRRCVGCTYVVVVGWAAITVVVVEVCRVEEDRTGQIEKLYCIEAMHSCKNPQLPIAAIAYQGTELTRALSLPGYLIQLNVVHIYTSFTWWAWNRFCNCLKPVS